MILRAYALSTALTHARIVAFDIVRREMRYAVPSHGTDSSTSPGSFVVRTRDNEAR
jgi:hypothetical protein